METPDRSIKYVGFIKVGSKEYVVGTNSRYLFYGPFRSPYLDYLEEHYVEPIVPITEFERLLETQVYQKDLKEECKKLIEQYDTEDGKYYSKTWKLIEGGDLRFNMTKHVNELKKFIEE